MKRGSCAALASSFTVDQPLGACKLQQELRAKRGAEIVLASPSLLPFPLSGEEETTKWPLRWTSLLLLVGFYMLWGKLRSVGFLNPNQHIHFPDNHRASEGRNYPLVISISLIVSVKSPVTGNWYFIIHSTNSVRSREVKTRARTLPSGTLLPSFV